MSDIVLNEESNNEDLVNYLEYLETPTMVDIQDQISNDIPIFELYNQTENVFSNEVTVSTKNLYTYFQDRYRYAHLNLSEMNDEINDLNDEIAKVSLKEISLIEEIYGFNIEFDNIKTEDLVEYTNAIYTFFILKYKAYLINFGKNYVMQNKSALQDTIGSYDSRSYEKNLSYEVLKSQIDNGYTAVIYFLRDILGNLNIDEGSELIDIMTEFNDVEDSLTTDIREIFLDGKEQNGLVNFDVRFVSNMANLLVDNEEIFQTIRGSLIRQLKVDK